MAFDVLDVRGIWMEIRNIITGKKRVCRLKI